MRVGKNMMESSAASQDAKDEAAKGGAATVEAAKEQAAEGEATADEVAKNDAAKGKPVKEEADAECVSENQSTVKDIGNAQPSERAETAKESAVASKEDVSSKIGVEPDLQNGNEARNPTRNDNPPLKCSKCGETFAQYIQLDNKALDLSRSQCDQSSHTEQELGEHVATTHQDDTPTIQALKELENQQAKSCQQRNLFMEGFVQRGRQMSLAIDVWEMEASLHACQAQEAARQSQMQTIASAENILRMEEFTERMSQSRKEHALRMDKIAERMSRSREDHARSLAEPVQHQERTQVTSEEYLQAVHGRGSQEVMEHELEA
jgi:hypothetical protein